MGKYNKRKQGGGDDRYINKSAQALNTPLTNFYSQDRKQNEKMEFSLSANARSSHQSSACSGREFELFEKLQRTY